MSFLKTLFQAMGFVVALLIFVIVIVATLYLSYIVAIGAVIVGIGCLVFHAIKIMQKSE